MTITLLTAALATIAAAFYQPATLPPMAEPVAGWEAWAHSQPGAGHDPCKRPQAEQDQPQHAKGDCPATKA